MAFAMTVRRERRSLCSRNPRLEGVEHGQKGVAVKVVDTGVDADIVVTHPGDDGVHSVRADGRLSVLRILFYRRTGS
ncbi:hypothetical protein CYMTET_28113 [Cymbomonas tetramitiformis]|uniref:Uncharacterized protein n=1 Tax=Cymbomonas tetramitiformis TaxID=36881 RepID=A0AAE0KW76_9CHLO|nr:hypothetical protein CYMTET_28113 [Cymbomonas tetramitiformis]